VNRNRLSDYGLPITDYTMTITLEQLNQLPTFHRTTISEAHLDAMGHMNVRHYMAIFDEAAWRFFASFGMDEAYHTRGEGGGFALRQSVRYLAECRVGESVSVRARLIGRSVKRTHFMLFMVNESKGNLAATLETLGSHADIKARRTSPYPPHIAARMDAILAEHQALQWTAPVCGVIRP
jgi:acyl-CoA thioester hydrolase